MAGAILRSAPNNWFLSGEDGPSRTAKTNISDPYAQSSWVFAALGLISQPLTGARVVWKDDIEAEIDDARLKNFWRNPARGVHEPIGLPDLIELTVALRGVAGSAFWILDDSWTLNSARSYEPIIVAAPYQMTPIWDGRRLSGWAYRDGAGRMLSLLKEQVIHLRRPNPGDMESLDGVAPWESVRPSAEAARAGAKFAKRTMDQNGDRGQTIIFKHAITEQQRDMIKAEIAEKRRAAERGEYRDSVFGGDLEIVPHNLSAITGEFVGQIAMSRDEIFVAYGVPPSMAAMAASYSVGAASDWYRLITGTCTAEGRVIAGAMARVSDYLIGYRSLAAEMAGRPSGGRLLGDESVQVEFDFSGHPVMAEIRTGRVEQLERLFKCGVPVATGNDFLELGMPEYQGWEERYLPVTYAMAGQDHDHSQDETQKSGADIDDLVSGWQQERKRKAAARELAKVKAQESARTQRWKRVDGARNADRKRVEKLVGRHLMAARAETIANLKKLYEVKSFAQASEYEIRAGVLDLAFDLTRWAAGVWTDMRKVLGGIFVSAASQAAEEVADIAPNGDFDPLTQADPRVVDHLSRRQNLISGASDEMHGQLVASLEEGIESGETLDQLTARVRALFTDFSKSRALTIARTETGAAYESARYLTFLDAGITQKGWLSGGEDGVTRATHQAADGQVRPMNGFFEVGEARLLHPHDQVGGAQHPGELINCRCVLTAEG